MSRAADGGRLLGGDAAESEVVELEGKKRRIAGAHQGFADDLLDSARECGDGNGIPDLDKKSFGPVSEPVKLGVGIFDGDECVVSFDTDASLLRAHPDSQSPALFR